MDSQHPPLQQTILAFDAYLEKQNLARLSLDEAAFILMKIDLFHQQVAETYGISAQDAAALTSKWSDHLDCPDALLALFDECNGVPELPSEKPPQNHYLMAVGCRLASDLNEAVLSRLNTLLERRESNLEALYKLIRKDIQDRQLAAMLIERAHKNRQMTVENGLALGLGMLV